MSSSYRLPSSSLNKCFLQSFAIHTVGWNSTVYTAIKLRLFETLQSSLPFNIEAKLQKAGCSVFFSVRDVAAWLRGTHLDAIIRIKLVFEFLHVREKLVSICITRSRLCHLLLWLFASEVLTNVLANCPHH